MVVSNSINQMYEEMKTWRQDLHRIPEIGLEEYKTSKYIKSKLSEFNIEYKDGYANTGIVAYIKGSRGNSDKSIYDIISECTLSENDEKKLMGHIVGKGVIYISTPFCIAAAKRLEKFNVPAFKIGSGECNNLPLI